MRTLLIPILVGALVTGTAGVATPARRPDGGWFHHNDRPRVTAICERQLRRRDSDGQCHLDGWQLTSNLATGDAPRFAKSDPAAPNLLASAAWSTVGSASSISGPVSALAVNGNDLYVGGNFTNAGGNPAA